MGVSLTGQTNGFSSCRQGVAHFAIAGWCSQSARLSEKEKVLVRCQVQRPSFPFIPFVVSSVSTRRCERRGAGANPAEGTTFIIVPKAKSRATGLQNLDTRCESEMHVRFIIQDFHKSHSPRRLTVRTSAFHAENTGASPVAVANSRTSSIEGMQRAFNAQSREHYPGGPFLCSIMRQ